MRLSRAREEVERRVVLDPAVLDDAAVAVACIGPVTQATAREIGLETRIVPKEYTIPALARAIAHYYAARTSRPDDAT